MSVILIVDDEGPIRLLLAEFLGRHGYATACAADPEEAMGILLRQDCAAVFLDLLLPWMSGMDLCREIRRRNPLVRIFAMSGLAELTESDEYRTAGFDGFFAKPFEEAEILAAVRKDSRP